MNKDLADVRLVATDLDGTLLRSDLTVSPRTRAALDELRRRGVPVVPVTARQPIGLRLIAEQTGFTDWALSHCT
jgi:HAD superfamily hydrolase (TIGR01484 family)